MPLVAALLLVALCIIDSLAVQLLEQLGADSADLLVGLARLADFALAVQDRMNVQCGS